MDARLIVIAVLVLIVASLGSALFQLARGGDSRKLLSALTWRVGMSVALFVTLLVLWRMGVIRPHGGP